MLKYSVLLVFCLPYALGQSWESRGRVQNFTTYFSNLVQETIYEVEKRGFCKLKLEDFTAVVNTSMYSWHVLGNVTYKDAFLLSIQKIDVTAMAQSVVRRTIDEEPVPFASVRGLLHFRDSRYGYDVIFDQFGEKVHRFTGIFGYTLTTLHLEVAKNLITNELSTSAELTNLSGGLTRMVYMPANNITEVLSRVFSATTTYDSIRTWGRTTLASIMLEVAQTKLDFPQVCFNNC